jgi:sulfite reductase (NADPH) hemoprotein beta-component
MLARRLREDLPARDLLAYCEAILRVYNLEGRRDNKYKARIKILVHETGADALAERIEAEFAATRVTAPQLPAEEVARIAAYFAPPDLEGSSGHSDVFDRARAADPVFRRFAMRNLHPHRQPGHAIVTVSLKPVGGAPGDATSAQMEALADIAERFSHGELRVSHEQNIVLPHVRMDDAPALHAALRDAGLATANAGSIADIVACPGLDFCALANARSIPVAQRIGLRFADPELQDEIGDLKIKISGCINACGHHHVGHIGILGVDRQGEEFYQITLGGSADETCAIGTIAGRGFSADAIVDAVETVVRTYLGLRTTRDESFLATYRRVGDAPFRAALYDTAV